MLLAKVDVDATQGVMMRAYPAQMHISPHVAFVWLVSLLLDDFFRQENSANLLNPAGRVGSEKASVPEELPKNFDPAVSEQRLYAW